MTEKRFYISSDSNQNIYDDILRCYYSSIDAKKLCKLLNELYEENKKLKFQNEELLYQIGYVGKNNKSCDGCECFLEDIGYCWMWDMNVKKEDIVVACDQRKVKNTKEMMSDD